MSIPVTPEIADFLTELTPVAEGTAVWGDGTLPLSISGYVSAESPPQQYVSSVRCVLFRESEVLVFKDKTDSVHLLPGGRCEPGETFEQTLHREIVEETGWTIQNPALLGFVHFHHENPAPPDYAYPHPDFLQLVFQAEAAEQKATKEPQDEWVVDSQFRALAEVETLPVSSLDLAFLQAALKERGQVDC